MNRTICPRETEISDAIRGGTLTPGSAAHVQSCPICSEISLVEAFLRANALSDHERATLPDPQRIWQRAQHQVTQQAIRIALRPIRFMKLIACIAFACSPWFRSLLPAGRGLAASWSKSFDLDFALLSKPWLATATEATLLLGISGTIVLLAVSSWYMLRQE